MEKQTSMTKDEARDQLMRPPPAQGMTYRTKCQRQAAALTSKRDRDVAK